MVWGEVVGYGERKMTGSCVSHVTTRHFVVVTPRYVAANNTSSLQTMRSSTVSATITRYR